MPSIRPPGFRRTILILFLLALSVSSRTSSAANPGGSAPVVLSGCVKPVESAPQNGPINPHKPQITRQALQASEMAAPLDFAVALKMQNFAELQARIAQGARITPAEIASRYAPSADDYQAVVTWLTGQGLTVTRQDPGRLSVFVRGKVSQVGMALNVQFARVSLEGTERTSAVSAPSVPATLAPKLLGINGLQPHIQPHKHLIQRQVQPDGTNGSAPYLPSQIAQAYSAAGLYTSNINGTGQTIAIVIDTFPAASDLEAFWSLASVNQSINNIDFIQVVSGTLPSPSGEETLDAEWASSIAPGVKVRIYATTSLDTNLLDEAYGQIYNDVITNPALNINQMSMSYGGGETYTTAGQVLTDDQYFAELAAVGVTVFASSGDGGSTPGNGSAGDETGTVQVESPASDPNVTGVGGTSLTLNSDNTENTEAVWDNSTGAGGGGVSIYFSKPPWQTGTGVSSTMREVPDISAAADPNLGATIYLNGSQTAVGGTSWSCPTTAGFCALLNQARSKSGLPSIGALGPHIYPLIGSTNLRDITSGSNATSKSAGLYAATVGYDEATGVGVPLVQNLSQILLGPETLPIAQTVTPETNATFSVVSNASPTAYQWQRMPFGTSTWSNLVDGGAYSGSLTGTLTIATVTPAMSGDQFQCNLTTGSGNLTTAPPSVLVVDSPLVVSTLAGQAGTIGTANGLGTAAQFNYPSGIAVDSLGNSWVADFSSDTIREVTSTGMVNTPYGLAKSAGSANGNATVARFNTPNAIAVDSSNNLYVADTGNNIIRKITAAGVVSTLAGKAGRTGSNNATGSFARFKAPQGIAVDSSGNVYVADSGNSLIRKITPAGVVTTLAGAVGVDGYANGMGTAAVFNVPISVAVDSAGNVYVADLYNNVVRKITPAGVVTTPYGQVGVSGHLDGIGNSALFNAPLGVAVDGSNNLYITDSQVPPATTPTLSGNNLIRRATTAGVVSTIAGQAGVTGSADGTGSGAEFDSLQGVAINSLGEVLLADTFNQTIRVGGITPVIVTQLGSQTVTSGQSVTFSVTATGNGTVTYQWYMNGNLISGATGPSYSIPSTTTNSAGTYTVVATDPFGSTTSSSYSLTVNPGVPALPLWGWVLLPTLILLAAARSLPPKRELY